MTVFYTLFLWLVYWEPCISVPCIPANTCIPKSYDGSLQSFYTNARMWSCDSSGTVRVKEWTSQQDCSGDPSTTTVLAVNGASGQTNTDVKELDSFGDIVVGTSTIKYKTDYLQGTNCPVLNSPSSQCTDYMILKHRGDRQHTKPYLDIGDNCGEYTGSPSTFNHYDTVFAPVGCVGVSGSSTLSSLFFCNSTHWGYEVYDGNGCSGTLQEAQSDVFEVNTCGYMPELTRPSYGIQPEWWYWYDLECCPNTQSCVASPDPSPTPQPVSATPQPVSNPNPTPQPASGPNPTPQPASTPVVTPQPVTTPVTPQPVSNPNPTPHPTDAGSQPSSPTTPAPTSPGTAKPTSPTTAQPTNTLGQAAPTSPTTAAPTSRGTARPTPAPTSQAIGAKVSIVLLMISGLMVTLNV
eukprot:323311_1